MADMKTIEEWEKEKNCMVRVIDDPKKVMTEEEFNAIPIGEITGVDHVARIDFLKSNDYEITRENMINPHLSSKG